jgi:hypothetical protein
MSYSAVIIPSYNRPELLSCAVASAACQVRSESMRIIVVDNGSEAATVHAIARLKERFPGQLTVVHREVPTANLAALYNMGLDHLEDEEIVAFLDDDNTMPPNRLELACSTLRQRPELAGLYTDACGVLLDAQAGELLQADLRLRRPESLLSIGQLPAGAGVHVNDLVLRRSALEWVGAFDEAIGAHHGTEMAIRLRRAGLRLEHLPVVGTNVGLHAGQRSQAPEYPADEERARAYIAGKELGMMRKQLKLLVVGASDYPDPYGLHAIRGIPWLTTRYVDRLPVLGLRAAIAEFKPSIVVVNDMLAMGKELLAAAISVRAITVGCAYTAAGTAPLTPEGTIRLLHHFPHVNWLVTDHEESATARPRVLLSPAPPAGEEQGFWRTMLDLVRANRGGDSLPPAEA